MNQSEEAKIRKCIKQHEEANTAIGKTIAQYIKQTRELNKLFQEREPVAIKGKELQAALSKLKQKKSCALFYLRLERQNFESKAKSKASATQASLKDQLRQLTARIESKKREIQEREDTIQSYTRLLQHMGCSSSETNATK